MNYIRLWPKNTRRIIQRRMRLHTWRRHHQRMSHRIEFRLLQSAIPPHQAPEFAPLGIFLSGKSGLRPSSLSLSITRLRVRSEVKRSSDRQSSGLFYRCVVFHELSFRLFSIAADFNSAAAVKPGSSNWEGPWVARVS